MNTAEKEYDLQQLRQEIDQIDTAMAALFEKRLQAVEAVGVYKQQHGLPLRDPAREEAVVRRVMAQLRQEDVRALYPPFIRQVMALSRSYEAARMRATDTMPEDKAEETVVTCRVEDGEYPIVLQRGSLHHLHRWMQLDRRVCIVTDDGVPAAYAEAVAAQCARPIIVTLPQGEENKTLQTAERLWQQMLDAGITRGDCVVAVGGGVVGDIAGFAAACYMRGVEYYAVPTTVLAQVDASVGGKTGVDLHGVKNVIGAFYQPKAVVIDPEVLSTLPRRQWSNGMAEAVKMGVIADPVLFSLFEDEHPEKHLTEIIHRAICAKRDIVQQDVHDNGQRQILNFGHTLGHALEAASMSTLLHGECVALGMLPFCSKSVAERLVPVLQRVGLPTELSYNTHAVWQAVQHDKKIRGDEITVVWAQEIGQAQLCRLSMAQLKSRIG